MANLDELDFLKRDVFLWNRLRSTGKLPKPDFRGADLREVNLDWADLSGADLSETNLSKVRLRGANLNSTNLSEADLSGANLRGLNLSEAILKGANLRHADFGEADLVSANLTDVNVEWTDLKRANLNGANLSRTDLRGAVFRQATLFKADLRGSNLRGVDLRDAELGEANLSHVDLTGANLDYVRLIDTNLERSDLTKCHVYGVSAWNLKLNGALQKDLIITKEGESTITVDRLEVAQFIYLLLNNLTIRHFIDTVTSKIVLILGRFTEERKSILDALRSELTKRDYLPVLFDWDKPSNRDLTETVVTLAHLAKFVIADITDARSIPQELMAIVPALPSVPVQPLLLASQEEYGMFEHLLGYKSVLPVFRYDNQNELLSSIERNVIDPAELKLRQIAELRRSRSLQTTLPIGHADSVPAVVLNE